MPALFRGRRYLRDGADPKPMSRPTRLELLSFAIAALVALLLTVVLLYR